VARKTKMQSRKELLKKDDAFINAANQGAQWVSSNRLQVIVGVVLVVGVILGTWGAVEYFRVRDERASVLYKRALVLMDGEILAEGSEDVPNPDGIEPTFATEKEKWEATRAQLEKVIAEAKGSGVAKLAAFLAADLSEKLDETVKAEEQFLALVKDLSNNDSLFFLAVERAAYLQEARGDAEGALRTLGKLVNVDGGFYADIASFHQARLYMAKGESTRAKNLLERVEEKYPSSSVMDEVKARLAILPVEAESKSEVGEGAKVEPKVDAAVDATDVAKVGATDEAKVDATVEAKVDTTDDDANANPGLEP